MMMKDGDNTGQTQEKIRESGSCKEGGKGQRNGLGEPQTAHSVPKSHHAISYIIY